MSLGHIRGNRPSAWAGVGNLGARLRRSDPGAFLLDRGTLPAGPLRPLERGPRPVGLRRGSGVGSPPGGRPGLPRGRVYGRPPGRLVRCREYRGPDGAHRPFRQLDGRYELRGPVRVQRPPWSLPTRCWTSSGITGIWSSHWSGSGSFPVSGTWPSRWTSWEVVSLASFPFPFCSRSAVSAGWLLRRRGSHSCCFLS